MVQRILISFILLISSHFNFGQAKIEKNWEVLAHFRLYNEVVPEYSTGTTSLIGTTNTGAELGLLRNIIIQESFSFQPGILLGVSTVNYSFGYRNPVGIPPSVNTEAEIYRDFESSSIGIPLKIRYQKYVGEKVAVNASVGPVINVFLPLEEYTQGIYRVPYGRVVFFNIEFIDTGERVSQLFSKPKIDYEFNIGLDRNVGPNNNKLGINLKYNIGSKNVDETTFIAFPDNSELETTGNVNFNRNYFGTGFSYSFGNRKSE